MSEPYSVGTVTDFTTLYYEEDCSILNTVYELGSIILSEFTPIGICNSCLRNGQTWSRTIVPLINRPPLCGSNLQSVHDVHLPHTRETCTSLSWVPQPSLPYFPSLTGRVVTRGLALCKSEDVAIISVPGSRLCRLADYKTD